MHINYGYELFKFSITIQISINMITYLFRKSTMDAMLFKYFINR